MATEYTFEAVFDLDPERVLALIAATIDGMTFHDLRLEHAGLSITAWRSSPLRQAVIADAWGFRPLINVGFRFGPDSSDVEYIENKRRTIRLVVALLRQHAGDAVLLFNGEIVLLQRIGETLTLNEDWSEWRSYDLLQDVTLPYEIRPLPSPLL